LAFQELGGRGLYMDISEVSLISVFEAMDDGIMIIRDDFCVEFMNRAMGRVFGEGEGNKCYQVIAKRQDVCPWCRAGEVFEGEIVRAKPPEDQLGRHYELLEVPVLGGDNTISRMIVIYRDITEKKEYERRFKTSEEDYRRLFKNVRCGVYVSSKEGKFLDVNEALLNMLGYSDKSALLGIDLAKDLYTRPKDRLIFQKMIESKGQVSDYEVDFKRADGTPIAVSLTSQVRYDPDGTVLGYEGIIVDLSRRKMMEGKLREALAFLENIIQSSPNGILVSDMKGNILIWNRAMEETLGYTGCEVRSMNVRDVYKKGEAEEVMKMMRSHEHGGVGKLNSYPMRSVKRDGTAVEGNLSAAIVYDSQGKEIATVGIFVDLRERLEMERKLMETQEQLFRSEKLASIGRLAAGVAHELNNPLTGVVLCSHLVEEALPKDSPVHGNLQKVLAQANRCKKIVEGLLDFSRQREPESNPLDLNAIIENTFALIENQTIFQNIKVIKNLAPNLPPVSGDSSQLQQVFIDLAINATQAMKAGGGTLTITSSLVDRFAQISFADTGCGIPPENAHKIFEPFFTTKADEKGTGLGLAVSHGIIKKHNGTITFESKVDEGTTFTIKLPLIATPPGS
jgi:PAS domain S-box-containing protein